MRVEDLVALVGYGLIGQCRQIYGMVPLWINKPLDYNIEKRHQ